MKHTKNKVQNDQISQLLKSPIFVVQKAAAPKNGVEFRQKSIGLIRCSLATSYNDVRHRATLLKSSCGRGWWWEFSDKFWPSPSRLTDTCVS